jgi:hypothetical protein
MAVLVHFERYGVFRFSLICAPGNGAVLFSWEQDRALMRPHCTCFVSPFGPLGILCFAICLKVTVANTDLALGANMVDTYTKIVLTVIAVALSVIAVRGPFVTSASALGDDCGSFSDPCKVSSGNYPLDVNVKNWPSSLGR